jgi:hypothetical protein
MIGLAQPVVWSIVWTGRNPVFVTSPLTTTEKENAVSGRSRSKLPNASAVKEVPGTTTIPRQRPVQPVGWLNKTVPFGV